MQGGIRAFGSFVFLYGLQIAIISGGGIIGGKIYENLCSGSIIPGANVNDSKLLTLRFELAESGVD
jgi:hypothetical protein